MSYYFGVFVLGLGEVIFPPTGCRETLILCGWSATDSSRAQKPHDEKIHLYSFEYIGMLFSAF